MWEMRAGRQAKRFPPYLVEDGEVHDKATKRALGLGPTVRFTSRVVASDYHIEKIRAACAGIYMEAPRHPTTRLFAQAVLDKNPLPRTKGAVYEFLARALAWACKKTSPGYRLSVRHWYDWETFAYKLYQGGLFTPVRCALIAMRGLHIYSQRRWRRSRQQKYGTIPPTTLSLRDDDKLYARKHRADTMRAHLEAARGNGAPESWPWCAFPQGLSKKGPRALPDRRPRRTTL